MAEASSRQECQASTNKHTSTAQNPAASSSILRFRHLGFCLLEIQAAPPPPSIPPAPNRPSSKQKLPAYGTEIIQDVFLRSGRESMLRWRHLTPGFVGGGVHRVKRSVLYFVAELGETRGSFHPPAVMIPQATTQTISCLLGFTAYGLNSHIMSYEEHAPTGGLRA